MGFDREEFIKSCLRKLRDVEGSPEELDGPLGIVLEAMAEPFEDLGDGGVDG